MDNLINQLSKRIIKFSCLLIFASLLASCKSVKRHDGPPNFYVDESRIPNAVPKPEPLAKYGNMPSYRVFGKRYFTLRTSRHYEETGTASWYGTLFNDRKTSSGEPYDMLSMTAAHKTLPLPTYVEVTNLRNHKKVIVKVNDRGPFESNRLIDLSYVAAKKLGMLGHGTATVHIKAIDPYTYGKPILVAHHNERGWKRFKPVYVNNDRQNVYIQVGAFKNRNNAEQLKHRLAALIHTPVKIIYPMENSKLYRVKVGPFKDTASANQITYQLKTLGIHSNKSIEA